MKTVQSWRKDQYIDKRKRTENPEIEPQYDQLMFERSQGASVEKSIVFSTNCTRKIEHSYVKK